MTGLYKNYHYFGEWEGFRSNGRLHFKETYTNGGTLLYGTSYDALGKSYEYKELGISPAPKNGYEGFYAAISKTITYPKPARKQGVQGKVYVQFEVDKNGEIIEVKTIKGLSKECNDEAERVVRESEIWNPGFQRGQPVKVKMIVPIIFKLN